MLFGRKRDTPPHSIPSAQSARDLTLRSLHKEDSRVGKECRSATRFIGSHVYEATREGSMEVMVMLWNVSEAVKRAVESELEEAGYRVSFLDRTDPWKPSRPDRKDWRVDISWKDA